MLLLNRLSGLMHWPGRVAVIAALAAAMLSPGVVVLQAQAPGAACATWQECRQLALEARAGGEFGRFHDLAWRAVQTGPANDPALMYLLARAQSLIGRPQDALVMLGRLVERGLVMDAAAEADFERARRLPGWADLEARIDRLPAAAAPPAPAPAEPVPALEPVPPAPPEDAVAIAAPAPARIEAPVPALPEPAPATAEPPPAGLRIDPRPVEEVSRFSAGAFVASGLAYDAVSRRFLLSDARGRRVMVIGEGLDRAVDLVREASARFHDVTAFEIDARRGDLWVASSDAGRAVAVLHRLQLISGRALTAFESPPGLEAVRPVDLAVTPGGAILLLDAAASRIIGLRAGGTALELQLTLDLDAPTSLTMGGDERTAYVAHRDGIARLDLQTRAVTTVTPPDGVSLGGFERIRWHQGGLVGIQAQADGARHVIRVPLNRGRAATEAIVIEAPGPDARPAFAFVAGDDLYYLVSPVEDSAPGDPHDMRAAVRRIRLR